MTKFVVVGGGSSGWMAAATLIRVPGADVTVIESPTVPKIGVGESTIEGIINWMNLLDIDIEAMMKETDASYKLGIKFEDFLSPGHNFHYPFGLYGINESDYVLWEQRRILDPGNHKSFTDTFFPNMALINHNRFKKDSVFFPHNWHALHFDASKFGPWLWEKYCKPRGTKKIELEVTHIETGENGIEWLVLSDGSKVTADLFIDCTGFKSLLLEGALGVPFNDYSNVLPNNMAWATHMPYIDKEKELVSYTNCTAIGNGWVWNIPLWSRIGTGYVYSNKFVTDEEALQEFKEHLRKSGRDPETLEYKKIFMKNGIHEKIWHKNVVAIGLAAGFIEPLESTGLWFTHQFSYCLFRILLRGVKPRQHDRDNFNFVCKNLWNNLVHFVCQHYALSAREDTEYWRSLASLEFPIDPSSVVSSFADKNRFYSEWPGINCIFTGFNFHIYDETYFKQAVPPNRFDWQKFKKDCEDLETTRCRWTKEALEAPKLFDVLKKIHQYSDVNNHHVIP
jgi:tryptophan halogenase